ncbi:MAG: roadblock/LC7 domain-containing protein [Candidatus Thermoplasmatota archaeon]|nr:roadblock/LC7 domain-containing protein [Candidatus Thermoplasmatota archaeon]
MDPDRMLMERHEGIIASAVITRKGDVISFSLPDSIDVQTFSIMCATIMGASATTSKDFGGGIPEYVVARAEGANILMLSMKNDMIFVCIASGEQDAHVLIDSMKSIASEI